MAGVAGVDAEGAEQADTIPANTQTTTNRPCTPPSSLSSRPCLKADVAMIGGHPNTIVTRTGENSGHRASSEDNPGRLTGNDSGHDFALSFMNRLAPSAPLARV
jgi:hypothetical protein